MCSECGAPRRRASRRGRALASRVAGFTLLEMIIAILVLGVGLVGVLAAFQFSTRGSGDTAARKQLIALAEELMEEIQLKPYTPQGNDAPAPCARNTFNDVSDYAGYATSGQVCTADGAPIAALAGFSVNVEVGPATLGLVSAALRIDVTVSRASDHITLTGWRTDYAAP